MFNIDPKRADTMKEITVNLVLYIKGQIKGDMGGNGSIEGV